MKFAQAFLMAAVAVLVLSLSASARAQSTKPGYATIVRIEGHAQYSAGDNVWHPLVVGQTLGPGNVIQSGVDSTVDIVLGERITDHIVTVPNQVALAFDSEVVDTVSYKATAQQNVIRMESDTVLAIDKLKISNMGVDAISDTELDLRQGKIFGTVKKLSAASQFLIKTPNCIAGVRGTTFMLEADGSIAVIDGSVVVAVTGPNGTITVVVGSGNQWSPATGQITPLTPQEMADALRTHALITTLVEGIIAYARDATIVCISPTHGNHGGNGHHGHWWWPF